MSAQNSGTIGVLTIDVISKPIRTNVDAIRLQGYFGKMSIGGDTRMSETSEDAHEESPSRQSRFKRTVAWEYLRPIVVAVALVFGFMRPFVVEPFQIPSGSMEDTLLVGDRILVCKFIYGVGIPGTDIKLFDFHEPARGDVFVFVPLHQKSRHFIKRIVAIGGDTVETKGGALYVNGVAVKDDAYTQNVCPAASAPATIFPPFAPPTSCPMTTLLRITSSRLSSSGQSSRTGYRSGSRKDTSSLWAIIAPEQRQPHLGHRPREPNQRGCLHGFLVIRSAQPEKALADLEGGGRHPI